MLSSLVKKIKNITATGLLAAASWIERKALFLRTYRYQAYQPLPWIGKGSKKRDESSVSRLELVNSFLEFKEPTKTMKDIGSNLGYFVFSFAERGCFGIGLEVQRENVEIAQFVQRSVAIENVAFANFNLTSQTSPNLPSTNVTIFFSVWHHLVVFQGYDAAIKMLKDVWASTDKVLFFESGEDSEIAALNISEPPRDWLRSVLEECCPSSKIQVLGTTSMGEHKATDKGRTLFAVERIN